MAHSKKTKIRATSDCTEPAKRHRNTAGAIQKIKTTDAPQHTTMDLRHIKSHSCTCVTSKIKTLDAQSELKSCCQKNEHTCFLAPMILQADTSLESHQSFWHRRDGYDVVLLRPQLRPPRSPPWCPETSLSCDSKRGPAHSNSEDMTSTLLSNARQRLKSCGKMKSCGCTY